MPAKSKLSDAEWVSVEAAWMEGIIPVRQLARDFGITDGAIRQHCSERDLIRDTANAKRQRVAAIQAEKDGQAAKLSAEATRVAASMVIAGGNLEAGAQRDALVLQDAALAFASIIGIERARVVAIGLETDAAASGGEGVGSDAKDSVVVLGGLKDSAATVKVAIEGYMKVRGLDGEQGKASSFEDWMRAQGALGDRQ